MVVSRHYARVGARLVHYRLAGDGPPVVLVHQSPRSAAEYLPLIAVWAKDFTVIAPDTPGNGQSDPLALAAPGIPDYAAALLAFLDTLGIEKAGFYGYHTGAATVACLAHQAPARMVAGVANGFAIMQDAERKDFLAHYLPAVPPAWDGSHLAWAWARIREQSVFFPWYRRHDDARLAYDAYTPEAAQEHVMDMLRPGDAYRAPYRAAFAFERERCFDGPTAPLTIMAAPPDPLFAHLDRLGALPETVSVYRGRDRNDALARARAILRRALANARLGAPGPTPTPRLREAARPGRGYANLETGRQIHFRHSAWSKSRPVMILHDIGLSSRVVEADCAALAQTRPVLAPDLPGHGASDPRTQLAPEAIAAWLLAMLDALDINSIDLVCH
ncbi:MAG: alpha/beta fold hydrolase, partial [Alphaproteobacteria bacterium]